MGPEPYHTRSVALLQWLRSSISSQSKRATALSSTLQYSTVFYSTLQYPCPIASVPPRSCPLPPTSPPVRRNRYHARQHHLPIQLRHARLALARQAERVVDGHGPAVHRALEQARPCNRHNLHQTAQGKKNRGGERRKQTNEDIKNMPKTRKPAKTRHNTNLDTQLQ